MANNTSTPLSVTGYAREAQKISSYLLKTPVQESEIDRYAVAMHKLDINFSKFEDALWERAIKSKTKMAFIDAGLALKDPNNNVRRKIFVMLAILEASPNYTDHFLSKDHSFFYIFKIVAVGVRAVFRAIIGFIWVNLIKRKCS